MNKVILIGRLSKEPEIKILQNGTEVLSNTIAVQKNYKNPDGTYGVDFINFVAYKGSAKIIADYFHKGDGIALTGSWNTRNFQGQNGQTIYVNELLVENVEFLPSKKQEPQNTYQQSYQQGYQQPNNQYQQPYQQQKQTKVEDPFASLMSNGVSPDDLPF